MSTRKKYSVVLLAVAVLITVSAILIVAGPRVMGRPGGIRGWMGSFSTQPPTPEKDPESARVAVASLGRIAPDGDVVHVGASAGDRLDRVEVVEGQAVGEGDTLAYLESHAERLAEQNLIAAQLQEARDRLEAETAAGQAQIREAKIALSQVEQVQPRDVSAQEFQIQIEEARVKSSTADYARAQQLKIRSAIPAEDLDHQVLALTSNQRELARARVLLDKLKIGHDLDLEKAAAQVKTAEANLERTRATILVRSLEKDLELAQARVRRTVLRAPHKGRILKVHLRPGEVVGVKPLLELGDTDRMDVVAEVYETDIDRVRLGQAATVTLPGFDAPQRGTVTRIGRSVYKNDVLKVDPASDADTRVVEVRIRLENAEPADRLINMQVEVRILPDATTDAAGAGRPTGRAGAPAREPGPAT